MKKTLLKSFVLFSLLLTLTPKVNTPIVTFDATVEYVQPTSNAPSNDKKDA